MRSKTFSPLSQFQTFQNLNFAPWDRRCCTFQLALLRNLQSNRALSTYLPRAAVSFLFLPAHCKIFEANTHYSILLLLWHMPAARAQIYGRTT
jgi:hypothetical protein